VRFFRYGRLGGSYSRVIFLGVVQEKSFGMAHCLQSERGGLRLEMMLAFVALLSDFSGRHRMLKLGAVPFSTAKSPTQTFSCCANEHKGGTDVGNGSSVGRLFQKFYQVDGYSGVFFVLRSYIL
jgi:hypothetical protein